MKVRIKVGGNQESHKTSEKLIKGAMKVRIKVGRNQESHKASEKLIKGGMKVRIKIGRNQEFHKTVAENIFGDGVAWKRGRMLGKGGFGSVYLAISRNPSIHYCFPSLMAVKSAEASVSSTLHKEGQVLRYLAGCPEIIQCFGDETTIGSDGRIVYNLLLEFGSGGTLADRIKRSGHKGLSLYEVKCYTRSILRGLSYIHENGFVHCDIKPENILLVPKSIKGKGTEFVAKICDLGLARKAEKDKKKKLERYFNGTPMYLSPEAVRDCEQGPPCDIWSLGCVVLEMLTGKPAWDEGMDQEDILKKIGRGVAVPKKPRNLPYNTKSFIECCLTRKAARRLSAKTLLHHPFVTELYDDEEEDQEEDINDTDEEDWSCLESD